MSTTSLIVLSDLHLADNHQVLEGFGQEQQAALEGLLETVLSGNSLGNAASPLLILNGDTFDLLTVPPYPTDGYTTPQIGLAKLAKIAQAHEPFFKLLGNFLERGGRVTFLIGNHDVELCFSEVRTQVARLIDPLQRGGEQLHFCLDQRYLPLPDVSIEHGNQYDFWNYADEIWDAEGKALTPEPERIELPLGTQYVHRAALPISLRYPYFEHFAPSLGILRQFALLSILDPALVMETVRGIARMISPAYQPLQDLAPGDEQVWARLFTHAMTDFAAFQQEMSARRQARPVSTASLYSPAEVEQNEAATLATLFRLREALEGDLDSALRAIFAPPFPTDDEDTTRGMQAVLRAHPPLRIALAGHTHHARVLSSRAGDQLYVNTGTWTQRLALPTPLQVTPALYSWLSKPDLKDSPLTDKTRFVFAWISAQTDQPSTARLCVWEGGSEGNFRIIEQGEE